MAAGTEDNNLGKIESRKKITLFIKEHMKQKDICMFDFLGAGVGADYYTDNIKTIKRLTLLDNNKMKYKKFLLDKYKSISQKGVIVEPINLDIDDYFGNCVHTSYNVLNLDFCGFFYKGAVDIINKALANNIVSHDGILLCTFQIKGYGINMQKGKMDIETDPRNITMEMIKIIIKNNYYIKDINSCFCFTYKSSPQSTMFNIGFKFIK